MKRPLVPLVSALLVVSSLPAGGGSSVSSPAHDHRGGDDGARSALSEESSATATSLAPCPLRCDNGGVCRHGSADASSLHPVHSMYTPRDAPFLDASHSDHHSRAHCVCPAGYVGPTCAVALETCRGGSGDGDNGGGKEGRNHHCFHGAPCRAGIADTGREFYYCECSEAGRTKDGGQNRHNSYAGHMCQHASTTACGGLATNATTDGRDAEEEGDDGGDGDDEGNDRRRTTGSFCTNWGTCREGGEAGKHPGCDCPDEWEGPHCEYRKGTDQRDRHEHYQQHQPSTPSSESSGTAADAASAATSSETETPAERAKRRSGLVFVIVAVLFSAIGMSSPQLAKWWRIREEARTGAADGNPTEVVVAGGNTLDPDGTTSMSSVSMISETETITVAGYASITMVVPDPSSAPPPTDVLV